MAFGYYFVENNPEQNEKWDNFKKRNHLRKLDLVLNCISKSEDEIRGLSNADFKKLAVEVEEKQRLPMEKRTYKIHIPSVEVDFPELAEKKTPIYPLPISHENQCSSAGMASNLDRFTEEFSFTAKRDPKYLPINKSGKEFALEKAYERYAFMKTLEHHKNQQSAYEKILRRTPEDENLGGEEQPADEIVVFVEEDTSLSDSDED